MSEPFAPALLSKWQCPMGGTFTVESDPVYSDAIKLWFVWGVYKSKRGARRMMVCHCQDFIPHLQRIKS